MLNQLWARLFGVLAIRPIFPQTCGKPIKPQRRVGFAKKALSFNLAISLSKPLQRVFKFIFLCGKTGGRAAAHRRLGEAKEGGYWSLRL